MVDLNRQEPIYGDKVKLERREQAVPIQKEKKAMAPTPTPAREPAESVSEPVGLEGIPPHLQNAMFRANWHLKKANEARPNLPGIDERTSGRVFLAQIATILAETTGDEVMVAAANAIMDEDEDVYELHAKYGQAIMDDIDISQGSFVMPEEVDAGVGNTELDEPDSGVS